MEIFVTFGALSKLEQIKSQHSYLLPILRSQIKAIQTYL